LPFDRRGRAANARICSAGDKGASVAAMKVDVIGIVICADA
jgi:hypothetical protein